jgi:hypothetical protein
MDFVYWADDYLIAAGATIVSGCTAIQIHNSVKGTGGEALSPEEIIRGKEMGHKIDCIMAFIERFAFGFIKLSLLLFYRRIFDVWPSFHITNTIAICIVIIWMLTFAISYIFLCGVNVGLHLPCSG